MKHDVRSTRPRLHWNGRLRWCSVAVLSLAGCFGVDDDGIGEEEETLGQSSDAIAVGAENVPSKFSYVSGLGRTFELPLGLKSSGFVRGETDTLDPALVDLGNLLFFDERLSKNGQMSCATCHVPANGYSTTAFSSGVAGNLLPRTTPSALNRGFGTLQNWIGGEPSLEAQSLAPIVTAAEMGLTSSKLVSIVSGIPGYKDRFSRLLAAEVISAPAISPVNIGKAIAAFQRAKLLSGNSPVDRYEAGDTSALTGAQIRGRKLFRGKARCHLCHSGPNFTDEAFHHIVAVRSSDLGRQSVTGAKSDFGEFKTPSLRNAALRRPYFHNADVVKTSGPTTTLKEVVRRYNGGPPLNEPNEDPLIVRLGMTPDEISDVAAFISALTGSIPVVPHLSSRGVATSGSARENIYLSPDVFEPADYRAFNSDLADLTDGQLRSHWLSTGIREGRTAKREFALSHYLRLYPAVHDAVEGKSNANQLALDYYLDHGRRLGHVGRMELAPAFFSVADYRAHGPRSGALLPAEQTIDAYLRAGAKSVRVTKHAPKGYFVVGSGTSAVYGYANGVSYCRLADAAAAKASFGRTDLVGMPRLFFIPPNLANGGACRPGTKPPQPTVTAPARTETIVPFECRASSSSKGCSKVVTCPGGKAALGIRAACNLEYGSVPASTVTAQKWNTLSVLRPSDDASDGHCRIDSVDLRSGKSNILMPPEVAGQVSVGCSERDENGGDCHIRGELLCY